jgi:hypothetical protein
MIVINKLSKFIYYHVLLFYFNSSDGALQFLWVIIKAFSSNITALAHYIILNINVIIFAYY